MNGEPNVITRFFFTPTRPQGLAACRIIYCGLLALLAATLLEFRGWDVLAPTLYHPVSFFRFVRVITLPDPAVGVLHAAWVATLVSATVGFHTRVSLILATILAVYLLGLSTAFGKVSHSEPITVLILAILEASRCGDAWSLDARRRPTPEPSGEYRWPIRMVWLLMTLVFFLAGVQKLAFSGLGWMDPAAFTPMTLKHFYHNEPPTDLARFASTYSVLMFAGAAATIVGEVLFPLALFRRGARVVLVGLMFALQVNIALSLGVYFWPFLIAYVFWLPWDRRLSHSSALTP